MLCKSICVKKLALFPPLPVSNQPHPGPQRHHGTPTIVIRPTSTLADFHSIFPRVI